MSTFDPDALECLAAIVEEGGFERAAQRLSITQSAVSQRLRALEAQVGTVLIVRSRPLKPTSAGQLLLKHTKQMRLLRADLERDLKELAPSSTGGAREEERISIAVNADSIATWALPALDELARQGLPMEIIADDQDFTQEWLREGQVLGCVTTLKQALRGCKVVPLGAMEYVAVAQADYARQHFPKGLGPHNFRDVPFIAFNRKDDMQSEFVGKAFGLKRVALNQLFVPSSEGQVRAVLAGWGASVVPELLARGLLEQGRLVNIAPSCTLPIQLYWHCWNLESEVLDTLTAALTQAAGTALRGASGRHGRRAPAAFRAAPAPWLRRTVLRRAPAPCLRDRAPAPRHARCPMRPAARMKAWRSVNTGIRREGSRPAGWRASIWLWMSSRARSLPGSLNTGILNQGMVGSLSSRRPWIQLSTSARWPLWKATSASVRSAGSPCGSTTQLLVQPLRCQRGQPPEEVRLAGCGDGEHQRRGGGAEPREGWGPDCPVHHGLRC